jgi:hypothetical protein
MSLIQKTLDELELYKISKKQKEFSLKKMEEAIKSANEGDGVFIKSLLSSYFSLDNTGENLTNLKKINKALLYSHLLNSEITSLLEEFKLNEQLKKINQREKEILVCYFAGGIYNKDKNKLAIDNKELPFGINRLYLLGNYFSIHAMYEMKNDIINGVEEKRRINNLTNEDLSNYIKVLHSFKLITSPFKDIENFGIDKKITILSGLISEEYGIDKKPDSKDEYQSRLYYNATVRALLSLLFTNEAAPENAIKLLDKIHINEKAEMVLKAKMYSYVISEVLNNKTKDEIAHAYLNSFLMQLDYPLSGLNILKNEILTWKVENSIKAKENEIFINKVSEVLENILIINEKNKLNETLNNQKVIENKMKRL